jgi:hypothetical protein
MLPEMGSVTLLAGCDDMLAPRITIVFRRRSGRDLTSLFALWRRCGLITINSRRVACISLLGDHASRSLHVRRHRRPSAWTRQLCAAAPAVLLLMLNRI